MKAQMIKKYYEFLSNSKARFNFLYGGANSGKSYIMSQFFIKKFFEEEDNKVFLVIRTTLPALKVTALKTILDLIDEYNLPKTFHKSDMVLTFKRNEMYFKSLYTASGGIERIKSFNVNYIWAEELTEFPLEGFRRLDMILRRQTDTRNQLYGTFNPVDSLHWIKTEVIDKKGDKVACLPCNYHDNPFILQDDIDELEALKYEDENYYRIYALGQWGIRKNIIYSNWDTKPESSFPSIESCQDVIYGIDFGYNNPSAIIEIRIKDGELWERELLYETHLTNSELIEKAKTLIPNRDFYIYADSAEPDRIKEFKDAKFNIRGFKKGSGSVKTSIDFVKRQKIHVAQSSTNLIKEKESYKYKEDADGHPLEEPVKWNDHLMDAERGAIYTYFSKLGTRKGSVYYRGHKDSKVKEEKDQVKIKNNSEEKKKITILSKKSNKGKVYYRGL